MTGLTTNIPLLIVTGDAFKAANLERMLSNFTNSYKLYWLKGIFEEVIAEQTELPLRLIAARMVASAWYTVTHYRLNLGSSDMIAAAIEHAMEVCDLRSDSSEADIISTVLASPDPQLSRRLDDLCRYVPYRLIRPFYDERLALVRKQEGNLTDARAGRLIAQFNREDPAGAPYQFSPGGNELTVMPDWARYFRENEPVIRGWLDMRLIDYLQARNPSVPAIPLKLYPPVQRDLGAARSYWKEALADHPFREIYSGSVFDANGYAALGPMSVDHFIPWSFVLHDEPWNLVPMFRDTNSSKGNRLPQLDEFLEPFCAQQFDALMTLRNTGRHRKIMESYLGIDPLVREYDRTEASLRSFTESVSRVVVPLHQIALNQGFPTWYVHEELFVMPA